jgi:hypothetical protein
LPQQEKPSSSWTLEGEEDDDEEETMAEQNGNGSAPKEAFENGGPPQQQPLHGAITETTNGNETANDERFVG